MSTTILFTVITLSLLGVALAVVLYLVAEKFKVYEDPRIDEVEALLPGVNCGGCGYPGCRGLSDAIVRAETMEGLYCPVGGNATMASIAKHLGREVAVSEAMVAVLRCSGAKSVRRRINTYNGAPTCAIASATYAGSTGCQYGCLSFGDCVASCRFDAMRMDDATGLPAIDEEKCTSCGACVKACPKVIIELRKKGPKGRRVFVSCISKDKGAVAKRACDVACIGCGKCVKVCPFDAITLENNLAYIDFNKCKLCRKCAPVCPTSAILEANFPPRLKEDAGISAPDA
jgi:Na+-translocating ferredoxin:NAD+ oxidoreductase subunit B